MLQSKSPKKGKKLLFWVFIVLLSLGVIAAAGYATSLLLTKKADTTPPTATRFASAEELVSKATILSRGAAPTVETTNTLGGLTPDGQYVYYLPAYQVPGYQFQTQPTSGNGSGNLSTSEVAKANYKSLKQFFVSNHFTLVKENPPSSIVAGTNTVAESYAAYDSDQMRCAIWNVNRSTATSGNYLTAVGCAKKSDYAPAAKAAQPFYDAYKKYNKAKPNQLVFGPATLGTSGDYDYAIVYQEDSTQEISGGGSASLLGYYYKKKTDSAWLSALISDDTPTCESFTDEFKAAFIGVSCFDTATQANRPL